MDQAEPVVVLAVEAADNVPVAKLAEVLVAAVVLAAVAVETEIAAVPAAVDDRGAADRLVGIEVAAA